MTSATVRWLCPKYEAFLEAASPCLYKQIKTCLLLYMIICLPVYLPILLIYLCMYLPVMYVCLSYPPIYLVYLSMYVSILSDCLPVLFIYPPICPTCLSCYLPSCFSFLLSNINHLPTYHQSMSFLPLYISTYLPITIYLSFITFTMKLSRPS